MCISQKLSYFFFVFRPSPTTMNIACLLYSNSYRMRLVDYVQWTQANANPVWMYVVFTQLTESVILVGCWLLFFLSLSFPLHSLHFSLNYSSIEASARCTNVSNSLPKFEWLYNSIDICNTPVVYSSIHFFFIPILLLPFIH